jgi:tetratricopeptide (TPR) repeat protein
MSEKVSLYNPRDTPPEQLEAMLTGREPLLKELLDSLREQAQAPSRQHWLLRGPRGIGKTHLTGIIHHRVSTDPTLSKVYLPLWLGEADVYEVYSPATLLMRIAERLVEAVPDAKLAEALRALESPGDEDALFEELAAHLSEEAERQGRILLVLMENLDALFESFAPKQRTAQTRQLRSLLLGNARFLFISTTPTRHLKELSDPKAPLFAHLKERQLRPLNVEEIGALFTRLAQLTGRKELLGEGPDAALKQRIIHQLTGGLPRSVVMAFEVLRDKEGIQPLVEDLRVFLDAQTAYFEARLSRLAPRARAIVTTLALADQNLTLKEISEKSLLPEKSLSTLVARLEEEGQLEAVGGSGGKGTLYGLSEGLFRIWYQFRKGRLLLAPLVHFLAYWYDPGELQDVAEAMQQRLTQEGLKPAHAAKLALFQIEAALRLATSERGRRERERIWEECRRAVEEAAWTQPPRVDSTFTRALDEVIFLMTSGKTEEGKAALDQALAPYEPLSEAVAFAACALLTAGVIKSAQGTGLGNVDLLKLLVTRFGSNPDNNVQIMLMPTRLMLAATLSRQGHAEQALIQSEAVRSVLESNWFQEKSSQQALRKAALTAWHNHIQLLHRLGRGEEAVQACEEFRKRFQNDPSADTRSALLSVMNTQADIYIQQKKFREAEEVTQEVLRLYVDPSTKDSQTAMAEAKLRLIQVQLMNGRLKLAEAERALDAWLDEIRRGPTELPSEKIRTIASFRDFVDDLIHKRSTAAAPVRAAILNQDPVEMAPIFLMSPSFFIRLIPRKELIEWLRKMLQAELPAEQKEQLRLNLSLVELLDTAAAGSPEASQRLRQALGRIPTEMQGLFKSLLDKVRGQT